MGKISLFFTFALLIYLIGKVVTDERNRDIVTTLVRNVDDRVTILAAGVDRVTATTSTAIKRDLVTTPATDVDRDTVTQPAKDVDRGMVTTLDTAAYSDTVQTPATNTDTDQVKTPNVKSLNLPTNGDLSNCSEFVLPSCSQQCGIYRPLPCSCDRFCLIYKNCCPDYEMVCAQDAEIYREEYSYLIDVDITCLESPTLDTDLGLQVISGCQIQASEESKRLCNPTSIKPVTLINTTLHFMNIHCLICNGFDPNHTTKWNLQIVPNKIEGDLIRGDFEKLIQSGQFSVYALPTPGITLTYCCNQIIDQCVTPTAMEDKCCSSHSSYLKYGSKRKYCLKNHFCAECHKNLYPDICQWKEMDFADMKTLPRMAFLVEMGDKGTVRVKSYGTRNQMLWLSAECKSPLNEEFGLDITNCILRECRGNIQLSDGNCLLKNKIFCFIVLANLSLIDQNINMDMLCGLLFKQAIATSSQMNFTLGSFNTTFNKRNELLLCNSQFVNQTFKVNIVQFLEMYLPSVEISLSKTAISGNISICVGINFEACSDTPYCIRSYTLEISPHHAINKGSCKLIGNYVLTIVVLIKFVAAILGQ